jgi:hypothetical protein
MLGGTYFTPRAHYRIQVPVRYARTGIENTIVLLPLVHPFIAELVKTGDCKDRFFIGFPPGASGADGCMVIRNLSTQGSATADNVARDCFDVILVQQTLGKYRTHLNYRAPTEFCHTNAVKMFRMVEEKACRDSTDNVRLSILGACYVYTSDEQLTISGSSEYPVDKLKVDTKMFSQVMRALPSYNDPMITSLERYTASPTPHLLSRSLPDWFLRMLPVRYR